MTSPGGPAAQEATRRAAEPGFARATAVMALGTALSRITGLARVIVLAATLGVTESKLADVYNTANTTPNVVYELALGGILSSIFVPVFVAARREHGEDEAWLVANSILTVTFLVLGALTVVTILAAPQIIGIYTSRVHDPEQRRLGALLLRLFMPQIVFYGVGAVMTGLLNANRRFGVPMFAPILNNLVTIATGLAFFVLVGGSVSLHGIHGGHIPALADITLRQQLVLGLGTTLGVIAMTMVQAPFLYRAGFRYRPALRLRHPSIRKMGTLAAYTVGYVVVNQLGFLVIPYLAYPVKGGFTAFTIGFTFFQLPHGIFAVSVMTALLPPMSEHAHAGDWAAFRAAFSHGVRVTTAILLPASAGYIVLAQPLVRLLLEHGNTRAASVPLLTRVLTMFVVGLLPFSVFQLALRAYYALQDTRTPLLVNIVAVSLNVAVDVALFALLPQDWKVAGLAMGNSIAYLVGAGLLLQRLRRRVGGIDGARLLQTGVRVLLASTVMAVAAWAAARAAGAGVPAGSLREAARVGAGVAAGMVAYAGAARLFRIAELSSVLPWGHRRQVAAPAAGRIPGG